MLMKPLDQPFGSLFFLTWANRLLSLFSCVSCEILDRKSIGGVSNKCSEARISGAKNGLMKREKLPFFCLTENNFHELLKKVFSFFTYDPQANLIRHVKHHDVFNNAVTDFLAFELHEVK